MKLMCAEKFLEKLEKAKDELSRLRLFQEYLDESWVVSKNGRRREFRKLVTQIAREYERCGWNKSCFTESKDARRMFEQMVWQDNWGGALSLEGADKEERRRYEGCVMDCTKEYYLYLQESVDREKALSRALQVVNMLQHTCSSPSCLAAVSALRASLLPLAVNAAKAVDQMPAPSVDPLYSYAGMASCGVVLLFVALVFLLGLRWQALSELKSLTAVLCGVLLSNVLRLVWFYFLRMSFLRYDAQSTLSYVKFIRIPDIIVLNIMFLFLSLFLFHWLQAGMALLVPSASSSKVPLIAFVVVASVATVYCLAVVIGYIALSDVEAIALQSVFSLENSLQGFWYSLYSLPWDYVTQLLSFVNITMSVALLVCCLVAMVLFRSSRENFVAVLKFGVVCFVLMACFALKLVYAVALMLDNVEPPFLYAFGINYILAEILISLSIAGFILLAYYASTHRKGHIEQHDEMKEALLSDGVPSIYNDM